MGASPRSLWRSCCLSGGCAFLFLLLVLSRRPEFFDTPAFFAEEGAVLYAQAWHDGLWRPLTRFQDGYLHTYGRIQALLSLLLPLSQAPRLFILAGALAQILPALFLLSSRMASAITSLRARLLAAIALLALPHCYEVCATGLLGHWHLALLAFLIVISDPPVSRRGKAFDVLVMILSGLSGPLVVVLLPVAVVWWLRYRRRWTAALVGAIAVPLLVQTVGWLLMDAGARESAPLGASLGSLLRILGGQVFLSPVVGFRPAAFLARQGWGTLVFTFSFVVGCGMLGYALMRGPDALRALWLFAALSLAPALAAPLAIAGGNQWRVMEMPGVACRYWFIPGFATVATVLWGMGRKRPGFVRVAARCAGIVLFVAVVLHWRAPPREDVGFAEHVRRFEEAPTGSEAVIPVSPSPWTMTLKK